MNRFLGLGLGVLLLQPFLTAQAPPTPTDFVLTTDIAARADRYLSGAPCANQALTQDAHVWTVLVQLKPSQIPQGTTLQDPDSRAYSEDNTLYVPVFTTSESTFSVSNGGKKYDGSIQGGWGIVKLRFVNLSLSEVGDVIDLLIKKKDDLAKAFSGAGVNGQVYSVTGTEESEPPKDNQPGQVVPAKPGDLLEAVEGGLNPEAGSAGDLLVGRLHSMETTHVTLNTLESRIGGVVTKRSIPVTMIAKKVVDLTINWANVGLDSGKAKQDVQNLASQGEPSLGEGAAGGKGKESKPIWIVDEPCLQFSVAPVLSAGQTTAAANFRLRYDFLSPKGTGFLKFRGEGDGAGSSNYFQRVAFNSDGGLNKKSSQFLLAFGGTGAYSLTQKNGQYLDEWRAGGKLQI